jgi:hypothetical protein
MATFQYGMLVQGVDSTATAAGTTALTSTRNQIQVFTGSTTQTVKLPATTGMTVGQFFEIYNQSTGALTIQFQDASSFTANPTIQSGSSMVVKLVSTGTTNGTWALLSAPSLIAGSTTFNNTVTTTGIGGFKVSTSNGDFRISDGAIDSATFWEIKQDNTVAANAWDMFFNNHGANAGGWRFGNTTNNSGVVTIDTSGNIVSRGNITSGVSSSVTGNLIATSSAGSNTFTATMATNTEARLIASGASNMTFYTNSNENMKLNSSGVLTVGSAAPRVTIDKANGIQIAGNTGFYSTDGTANIYISGDTGGSNGGVINLYGGTHPTKPNVIEFTAGGSLKYTFDKDGLVLNGTGKALPSVSTAQFFNQSGVGPTVSGSTFQVATGSTPAAAMTIDTSQKTVFTNSVTSGRSGSPSQNLVLNGGDSGGIYLTANSVSGAPKQLVFQSVVATGAPISGMGFLWQIETSGGTNLITPLSIDYLGNTGVGAAAPSNTRFYTSYTPSNNTASWGVQMDYAPVATTTGSYQWLSLAVNSNSAPQINTGVTNSAGNGWTGIYLTQLRYLNADVGTLTNLYGMQLPYGHYNTLGTGAITSNAYGIYLQPHWEKSTVNTAYSLYIANAATGGTGPTSGNYYGIYQQDVGAWNFFAGNTGIGGSPQPNWQLFVSGSSLSGSTTEVGIGYGGTFNSNTSGGEAQCFRSSPVTQAASFTMADLAHFYTQNVSIGAGSVVTRQTGLLFANALSAATNNAYIADNISYSGNWFINYSGTNPSYIGGNLGIAQSAPSTNGATNARNLVIGDSSVTANTGITLLTNGGGSPGVSSIYFSRANSGTTGGSIIYTHAGAENMAFGISGTSYLSMSTAAVTVSGRLVATFSTTSGYVFKVNNTDTTTGSDADPAMLVSKGSTTNTAGTNRFIEFNTNNGSTGSGYITSNGANSATFTNSSDERLKENIVDLSPQLDNIMALKPREFDYKDGSGHQIGFIAQEMQEVYPDVVCEGPDGMLNVAGWSKTESRLVKALQELKAQFDAYVASHP